MRAPPLTALAATVALLLTGCADGADEQDVPTPDEQPGSDAPDGEPDLGATPTVELVDAGQEPREELRFAYETGTASGTFTFTFTFEELRIDGEAGPDQPSMPIEVDATVEVEEVSEEGVAAVRFGYADPRIGGGVSFDEEGQAQLEEQLAVLEQVTGRFSIDARGRIADAQVEADDAPGFEQLADEFTSLAVPLPEEAVGDGAVWTVTQTVEVGGVRTEQRTTVELVERDGDLVTLALSTEGSSPPGPLDTPDAPDARVELVRSEITGSGTTVVDLTLPLPIRAEATSEADQELRVEEQGQTSTLEQRFTVEMVFELRPGEPEDGEPEDGEPEDGEPEDGEPEDGEPEDGEPDDEGPEDGEPDEAEPDES